MSVADENGREFDELERLLGLSGMSSSDIPGAAPDSAEADEEADRPRPPAPESPPLAEVWHELHLAHDLFCLLALAQGAKATRLLGDTHDNCKAMLLTDWHRQFDELLLKVEVYAAMLHEELPKPPTHPRLEAWNEQMEEWELEQATRLAEEAEQFILKGGPG